MTNNTRDWADDKRTCEVATAGPWEARSWATDGADKYFVTQAVSGGKEVATAWKGLRYMGAPMITDEEAAANACFIASARTGWPAALAEIDRLHDEVGSWYAKTIAEAVRADTAEQRVRDLEAEVERLRKGFRRITTLAKAPDDPLVRVLLMADIAKNTSASEGGTRDDEE
ncbi:hypothetical protein BBD42_15290 [Paenibacillus sp. BIHB 4019]|uniref:Uncharacterized protein n=1 Tax=Paenibacillus sp. BIHB 4019 TaxID=1870819 RepID=A0A1B2DJ02_9BACL|nr:hypothetical protein [Paenibacillus sp. BIHB 4019]ANY67676.1 hypothetical protein BBD42_15290 [Paenibacillus sp. BIHB 4019]